MIEVDADRLEGLLDLLEKDWGELSTVYESGLAEFLELVVAGPDVDGAVPPLRLPSGAQAACYWMANETDPGCVLALRPKDPIGSTFGVNVSTYFIEARRLMNTTLSGRASFRGTAVAVAERLRWLEPAYDRLFGEAGEAGRRSGADGALRSTTTRA